MTCLIFSATLFSMSSVEYCLFKTKEGDWKNICGSYKILKGMRSILTVPLEGEYGS